MTPRRSQARAPEPPPLRERQQPGLSHTLTGPIAPNRCQRCGNPNTKSAPLTRWLECDPWDRVPVNPRDRHVVVLCQFCADHVIEPHPRLYHQLPQFEPYPGAMGLCVACPYRDGTACTSPAAQRNDGPGIVVEHTPGAIIAHVCGGRGHSGWMRHYAGPALDCSGRPFIPSTPEAPCTEQTS